jgi:hypothetical protein
MPAVNKNVAKTKEADAKIDSFVHSFSFKQCILNKSSPTSIQSAIQPITETRHPKRFNWFALVSCNASLLGFRVIKTFIKNAVPPHANAIATIIVNVQTLICVFFAQTWLHDFIMARKKENKNNIGKRQYNHDKRLSASSVVIIFLCMLAPLKVIVYKNIKIITYNATAKISTFYSDAL